MRELVKLLLVVISLAMTATLIIPLLYGFINKRSFLNDAGDLILKWFPHKTNQVKEQKS